MHEPKTMEVVVDKACLAEENLTWALGGTPSVQTSSASVSRSDVRGS